MLAPQVKTVSSGGLGTHVPNSSVHVISVGVSALLYTDCWNGCDSPTAASGPARLPEWRAWLALPICALIAFLLNAILTTLLASRYCLSSRWDLIWHDNARWMLP